jgi:hypothetical protein
MKTRNGFVSNSSSTSFVIAAKKSEPCACCGYWAGDIISLMVTRKAILQEKGAISEDFFSSDPQSLLSYWNYNLSELEESEKWILDSISQYEKFMKNKEIKSLANEVLAVINLKAIEKRHEMLNSALSPKFPTKEEKGAKSKQTLNKVMGKYHYKFSLEREINDLKRDLTIIQREKDRIKKRIELLKPYMGKDWSVFYVNINNMETNLREMIELMADRKQLFIIERECN